MSGISDQFADQITSRTVDVQRFSEDVRGKVLVQLDEVRKDAESRLADTAGSGVTAFRRRRLESLITRVNNASNSAYRKAGQIVRSESMELVDVVGQDTMKLMSGVFSRDIISGGFTRQQLKAVVDDTLIQGSPMKDWWAKQSGDFQNRFSSQIRVGYLAGETNQDLVRRIRGTKTGQRVVTVGGKKHILPQFQGGVFGTSQREATTLVRTSVHTYANEARMQIYRENEDVIKGVQALVTLDGRTTEICIARSGGSWTLDGAPFEDSPVQEEFPGPPPWHYQCRSTLIPITKSFAELAAEDGAPSKVQKTLTNIPPGKQSSLDGRVASNLTYEGWLKNKSESFQKNVLGASKFKMWKQGKLTSLNQLIDQSGRPLSVTQLRKKFAVRSGLSSTTPRIDGPRIELPDHEAVVGKAQDLFQAYEGTMSKKLMGDDLKSAWQSYMSGGASNVQSVLRGTPESLKMNKKTLAANQQKASLIDKHIHENPIAKPIRTYTSDASLPAALDEAEKLIGAEFTEKGFLATTVDPALAMKQAGVRSVLMIDGPAGTKGVYSQALFQARMVQARLRKGDFGGGEFTFAANSSYKITAVRQAVVNGEKVLVYEARIVSQPALPLRGAGKAVVKPTPTPTSTPAPTPARQKFASVDGATLRKEYRDRVERLDKEIKSMRTDLKEMEAGIRRRGDLLRKEGLSEGQVWAQTKGDWAKFVELDDQKNKAIKRKTTSAHELLEVEDKASFKISLSGQVKGAQKSRATGATDFLESVVSKKATGGRTIDAKVTVQKGERAYALRGLGRIFVRPSDNLKVWVHELGHITDKAIPEWEKAAAAFLRERARKDPRGLTALRDLLPKAGYDADEFAWKDEFINPYIGKGYRDGSTEIISMGLEYLVDDPLTLARRDPEYFDFMVNLIRGHHNLVEDDFKRWTSGQMTYQDLSGKIKQALEQGG